MKIRTLSRILFICASFAVCDGFKSKFFTVCYDKIGCFNNTRPFHNALLFLPQSPDEIDVRYKLFTRQNAHSPQILTTNIDVVSSSNFDASKDTKFIIHGYKHSAKSPWDINMKAAILAQEDVNVILVDWVKGARTKIYPRAVANTRVVGAQLSLLMRILNWVGNGDYFGRMHLIGYSLGAHVAGYAGERIPGTGRITGLDPAGPLFDDTDPIVRLDPSDASFVDVIHTNTKDFGISSSVGRVDFFPNGGERQPGCLESYTNLLIKLVKGEFEQIETSVACSHMRVLDLFIESINSKCKFLSFPCSTCVTCDQGCDIMGYDAFQGNTSGNYFHPRGDYFLYTESEQPFCIP